MATDRPKSPSPARASLIAFWPVLCCALLLAGAFAPASASAKFRGAPNSKLQKQLNAIVESPAGPPGIAMLVDRGKHTEF
ncbi:MAG TPA: hypothetical protein VNR67_06340, partial [Solirubrobacterales bacterium]|nr:hypothetical protein [Solirubrobacterales bacterium]